MSNRRDYYFRQRVTESELDDGFTQLEKADQNLALDLGLTGVLAGAVVSPHAGNLTVDVSGPGSILDQLGQRIFFATTQNVNVAQDQNGVTTNVATAGNTKIVSVFVMFDRALSDPRIDGNSLTVFFKRDESFKFIVVQGGEALSPLLPPAPPNTILLADITRRFNQTSLVATDISVNRRQDAIVFAGNPASIRCGRPIDAVSQLLTALNTHINNATNAHAASAISAITQSNFTGNNVQAQLTSINSKAAFTAFGNTFTAGQTFNGLSGDANAALATTSGFTTRKLLWDIFASTSTGNFRLYASTNGFEITVNARWSGSQWVKDNTETVMASTKFQITPGGFDLRSDSAPYTSPFNDVDAAWTNRLFVGGNGVQTFNNGGNWISPGQTTSYAAWQGQSPPTGLVVGSGASFRKIFASTPSSCTAAFVTPTSSSLLNVPTSPVPSCTNNTTDGTFVSVTATTANANTRFCAIVTAT